MESTRTSRRLRRVLEMVPWVLSQAEPPTVEEVCRRFGVTRAELMADLELLFVCGVHPFTPDTLIWASIDEGRVVIQSDLFTRQPRPDPAEALALVAAGRAVAQTPAAPEALRSALAKLEAALPGSLGESLVVDLEAPDLLEDVRRALSEERRVEMEYFSYSRDALTTRRVDPAECFAAMGSWYLSGWCHLARGPRRFRVDRIRRLTVLGERAERAADARGLDPSYTPSEDDLRVRVRLSPRASWVREYYPLESEHALPDGGWRVVLPTRAREWLTRLLVRLGPDATVEHPPEVAADVADAGRRILARYGAA